MKKEKEMVPRPKESVYLKDKLSFKIPVGWCVVEDQLYSASMVEVFLRSQIYGCASCAKHQECEIMLEVKKAKRRGNLFWPKEWLIVRSLLQFKFPKEKVLCNHRTTKK